MTSWRLPLRLVFGVAGAGIALGKGEAHRLGELLHQLVRPAGEKPVRADPKLGKRVMRNAGAGHGEDTEGKGPKDRRDSEVR